jgi:hypothetical protein
MTNPKNSTTAPDRRAFLSLAANVAAGSALLIGTTPMIGPAIASHGAPDPILEAIEAHRAARANVRAATAETDRLLDLADKVAGKSEVIIPDLRAPHARGHDEIWRLPVAYEQDGQSYVVAPSTGFIDEYLPGEENEHLRQRVSQRFDEIEKARTAVYGDIDEIINGPASAECHAVDALVETVPTTLPGLLSLLVYLGNALQEDSELLCEQHIEPLIAGLGAAAGALFVGGEPGEQLRSQFA